MHKCYQLINGEMEVFCRELSNTMKNGSFWQIPITRLLEVWYKTLHVNNFLSVNYFFFSFLDPPSPPQIHGDLLSEQRSGDRVKLTCLTEGGNPLPTLVWLRNGLPLKERSLLDQIDSAVGKKSESPTFCN